MDCKRKTLKQNIVVPIFYDVAPSDVRKQMGVLQGAFVEHEKRFREGSDGKVEKWRAALTEVANLSGQHLLNEANEDEGELIKMIIKDVREKVNPTHLNVPDRQVGLERRVTKLNMLLNMESNCVRIVAIWGMGGIGKTTIAKRLYNLIQHKFERSGFLANVRETSQRPNGLDELQKKLLLAMLKRTHEILDKLKFLYLSHCHYLTRTPNFSRLYSLEELLLNDCKSLVEVDESIRCLNKLLVLDMKNCTELRKLPYGILMLKSLERLDVSGCSKLGKLTIFKGPLYKLWCFFFPSLTLPPKCVDSVGLSLTAFQASNCLKELNLKDCHLSYLLDEIGNLISLQTLDLTQNNLSTLPDRICNLSCLKRLRLKDNNVSYLPSGIGSLTSLEILNLSRNNLWTLPDSIGNLSCLKELLVGNNKLSHLPSEIGDLDSLEILKLRQNNGFTAFPESICKLVHLQRLSLYGCNLSHFPSGLGGLVSLWFLNVGKNNFCTIPDSISNHPRLETILLNNCAKVRSLPKLPRCTSAFAKCCRSLESLPLELDQLGWKVDYAKSSKLAENSYLTSLLKQLPKSKGLSTLQHVVSINVPVGDEEGEFFIVCRTTIGENQSLAFRAGDEEVPIWFPYHDRGPNVSFVVPPSPFVEQKMLGWILRLLLSAPRQAPYQQPHELCIEVVICNKIRKERLLNVLFPFRVGPTDVDHVWLQYMPQGYEGLQLEGGDEVEIPIYANDALVKNWAIDLIYEADEIHRAPTPCTKWFQFSSNKFNSENTLLLHIVSFGLLSLLFSSDVPTGFCRYSADVHGYSSLINVKAKMLKGHLCQSMPTNFRIINDKLLL
ncbi:hypothetical protein RHMOL_Rhmol01G0099000 [Rhododendron molle]|uniref:Uncharacterized protein n=1 Tax=Rhododendron molle TaxID=49168 RepID=A0ACC0Q2H1_RHOML|nr:hypothetical protein RHMOL_Rhmol01G0099000 [Rhododendron molle]